VQGRAHILSPREAGFEDGTLNYLGIPAVEIGLRHLESIGSRQSDSCALPDRLAADRLIALQHATVV
jgi:selenocysteine lyase/cysteine desulfurase